MPKQGFVGNFGDFLVGLTRKRDQSCPWGGKAIEHLLQCFWPVLAGHQVLYGGSPSRIASAFAQLHQSNKDSSGNVFFDLRQLVVDFLSLASQGTAHATHLPIGFCRGGTLTQPFPNPRQGKLQQRQCSFSPFGILHKQIYCRFIQRMSGLLGWFGNGATQFIFRHRRHNHALV